MLLSDPHLEGQRVAVEHRAGEPESIFDRDADRPDQFAGQDTGAQASNHDARGQATAEARRTGIDLVDMHRPKIAGRGDMPHGGRVAAPKDDAEYLDRMSRAIFSAGLNWEMVERKWPEFRKAFAAFSPEKVAKMTERDVKSLMGDARIVRNERKIRATIHNAGEFASLKKEFGSFKGYVASFGRDGEVLPLVGRVRAHSHFRGEGVDGKEYEMIAVPAPSRPS